MRTRSPMIRCLSLGGGGERMNGFLGEWIVE